MSIADKPRRKKREATIAEWSAETGESVTQLLGASPVVSPGRNRMRRLWVLTRRALILGAIVAVVVSGSMWVGYRSRYVTSNNAAVRGHVAEIGARLRGVVRQVEVDAGDQVTAGQVLVRMEDRHLAAEVQEARAEVAKLEREIEIERLDIDHQRREVDQQTRGAVAKVAAMKAQADAASARADDAQKELELRETLFSRDGVVSSEEVRNAETRRRTADAQLEEARANSVEARSEEDAVRLTGEGLTIRERKIGVLEADLQRAEATLAHAEAELDDASIRAPEDGAILRRIIQPGGSVDTGQPIISMWLGQDVWVEAWIDEDDIGAVSLGSAAKVTFHSLPGREFTGVVDKIGLATDLEIPASEVPRPRFSRMRSTPVVGVRIQLDEPPLDLMPGLSAVVAIRKAE